MNLGARSFAPKQVGCLCNEKTQQEKRLASLHTDRWIIYSANPVYTVSCHLESERRVHWSVFPWEGQCSMAGSWTRGRQQRDFQKEKCVMAANSSVFKKHSVQTPSGRISYTDEG